MFQNTSIKEFQPDSYMEVSRSKCKHARKLLQAMITFRDAVPQQPLTKIRIMNRKELELLLSINPRNLHKQADRAPRLVLYLSLQH